MNTFENPGLADFDLTPYKGVRGKNFYEMDTVLQNIVERYSEGYSSDHKRDMRAHLSKYGELLGGILDELTEKSHKEGKYGEIVNFDKTGNRIEEIQYSPEQSESRRISYEHGIVNLDFHTSWKHPFTKLHRYALTYMVNLNGEGGVTCPLAMTEGMIQVLQEIGTEEQKKKYLPLVAGENSSSYFMAGQYVTERVGGSNVAANRTIARKREDGKWTLIGEKWFCSNPGDLWVTTAKVEGTNTVGLFLVPRIKDDGSLNGYRLLRKKDIIGSRGKVTAEVVYEEVEAEALGRPAHGIANLIKYVITISRIHVGFGAAGNARRAYMEALEYAHYRTAYGKKLLDFPIYLRQMAEMMIRQTAISLSIFKNVHFMEEGTLAQNIIIPLLKYKSSSQASWLTQNAILCLGGNGILGDFSCLPRLHNDSIINETWEGTHYIIADHVLHALQRDKNLASLKSELESSQKKSESLQDLSAARGLWQSLYAEFQTWLEKDKGWKDMNRLVIADRIYDLFALSELMEMAAHEVSKGKKDSNYTLMANGYSELIQGKIPDQNSVLGKTENLKTIVLH